MSTHKHRAINAETASARPYSGPAKGARRVVEAAHDGVTYVYRCACGAQQTVNVRGLHTERGAWVAPDA